MTSPTKSIRIGLGMLFIVSMLAVIYTVFVIGDPEFFIRKACPGYTGRTWSEIASATPTVVPYITALVRKVGAFGLALTVGTLFVLFGAFRNGERWAWWFILVSAGGGWLVNIVFHFFSKSPLGLAMSLVGIAAVFLALIISAKDILAKKAA